MPPRDIKVVRVPLPESAKYKEYTQNFPRMGRLYLEIIENKAKIKQDLINKEYIPTQGNNQGIHRDEERVRDRDEERVRDRDEERVRDRDEERVRDRDEERVRDRDEERVRDRDRESDNESDFERDQERVRDHGRRRNSDDDVSTPSVSNSSTHTPQISRTSSHSEEQLRNVPREDNRQQSTTSSRSRSSSSSSKESAVSVRLKELLDDDNSDKEHVSLPRSRHLTPYKSPPTLAELRAKGQFEGGNTHLRDINHVPVSEQEMEDRKRELLFKYDLLKKSYPNAMSSIPEYTVHSDYEQMRKTYDSTVKRLSLDSTVDNYKQYMIGGFMVVEFVMGNFLGFEMQGFTQQQIINMNSYERLLIELGEKSYVPSGSKWPVEIRLLFLVIVNAGFFVISKMIMKKTGANVLNMINSMNIGGTAQRSQQSIDSPMRAKRRMKGPTINIDDIPDAT